LTMPPPLKLALLPLTVLFCRVSAPSGSELKVMLKEKNKVLVFLNCGATRSI
jgi:hypothetical protein